jgi:flagellar hook assembly protein FlgD
VRLTVYDLAGRRVRVLCDEWLGAGPHQEDWDGRDAAGREVAAGPYLLQLRTRQGIDVQKIMLAK